MNLSISQAEGTLPIQRTADSEVRASLTFTMPLDTRPYLESAPLTGAQPKAAASEERTVAIRDMRALAGRLSLDQQGFELRYHETKVDDLYDDKAVDDVYDSEIESLLKAATGADRVLIFDHTWRSGGPGGAANRDGLRGPATRVHVDYTAKSGPRRAGDIIGAEEVERVLASGGRIAQVNVWRPIAGPVQRAPLALADAESVQPEDLIATDRIHADRVGEIYNLAYAPEQRWYWAPEMERDEVLLIKGWDSRDDGRAKFTPHSAFELPEQDPDAPARESIEVRTYLVFEG